jgi:hypothetical protein
MVSLNFVHERLDLPSRVGCRFGSVQKAFSGEHKSAISARRTKWYSKDKACNPARAAAFRSNAWVLTGHRTN